jgi:hypothetical protein
MKFIDAVGGKKINMDLVAELRSVTIDGKKFLECFTANEERLGRIRPTDLPEEFMIIPDTTSTVVVVFYGVSDGTIEVLRYRVIAWRVVDGAYAEPMVCEELPSVYGLELSTGLFVFTEDVAFRSLERSKAIRRDSAWECERSGKPTTLTYIEPEKSGFLHL